MGKGAIFDWGDLISLGLALGGGRLIDKDSGKQEQPGNKGPGTKIDPEMAARVLNKAIDHFKWDRSEFLHKLNVINAENPGSVQLMIELFEGFADKHYVEVHGRKYYEEWTGRRLMSINPDYRSGDYADLSSLLSQPDGLAKFYARLEILFNNKVQQWIEKFISVASETLGAGNSAAAQKLRPLRIRLQSAARRNRINKGYKYP